MLIRKVQNISTMNKVQLIETSRSSSFFKLRTITILLSSKSQF